MERKYLILLIIGLVVISTVLYGCVNQDLGLEIQQPDVEKESKCIEENQGISYSGRPKYGGNSTKVQGNCCEGLVIVDEYYKGHPMYLDSWGENDDGTFFSEQITSAFCTKCGNGICQEPEMNLNCPEDCS